uniref:RNA binding motif protein 45 n=1 Tax=Myripristis murdjan TaxID=586833 RepID=A0A667Y8A6_9TELE
MDDYASKPPTENLDEPPNSRLFLVTSRSVSEDVIRESFSPFGDIQGVWVVKDKQTKESKGVSYVKFAKSSQACLAMEEMHGKVLMEGTKPIKVFIAQSRSSARHRDVEDEELTRIFVMIPKTFSEEDLKNTFKEYGDIEYCVIIKNKFTGESKGLGYVRYYKPSQAALAIENCDRGKTVCYRAILAEPRSRTTTTDGEYATGGTRTEHVPTAEAMNPYPFTLADPSSYPVTDYRSSDVITRCLMVSSRAAITQEQIYALFDIIPGMDYCELQRDPYGVSKGHAVIRYNNLGSAVYAKEKLNGFEYPPGNRLVVAFIDDGEDRTSPVGRMAMQFVATQMMSSVWNGPSTSQLLKAPSAFPTVSPVSRIQTDVTLPSLKKLAPPDSKVKERLFVVFSPSTLPLDVLEDVFCRYGSLIEVHLVPGRRVGYMKYADKQCADEAMAALHGHMVNGVRMKVMLADPPREESHKRPRTY